MDRLARNAEDLLRTVRELTERAVAVEFVKERLTFRGDDDHMSQLMLSMLAGFAQFERAMIRSRQAEGIAKAKAAGKYTGSAGRSKLSETDKAMNRERAAKGDKKAVIARDYSVSRETLYQALNAA